LIAWIAAGVGVILAGVVMFVLAIGLGILLGRRLDHVLESRPNSESVDSHDREPTENVGPASGTEVGHE
jgi:hypothetical protein